MERERERDQPWPSGEKGGKEREERLENKREREEERGEKTKRGRGLRDQGGAQTALLKFAAIFSVAR